jgi:hypothetical protein
MKPQPIRNTLLASAAALLTAVMPAHSQLLYSEDFDVDVNPSGNWVTNSLGNSPADLYFDYSTVGIPSAPNSVGGTTRGVKLNANLPTGVFPSGVSVSPMNFSLNTATNFVIYCDWWGNFNGPAPAGGSGSTQVGGLGYGTVGAAAQVVGACDSLFFCTSVDGQSADDYRAYSGAVPTSIQAASGAYFAGSRNNTASYYSTNFPGQTCPAAQLALYPQQTGTTAAGSQGWKWRNVKIEKLGPYVTWYIDNIPLMLVDATTNGIVGDKLVLMHSDINATASTDVNAAALAFGLFDNLRVSNVVANIVGITAPTPNASEAGAVPATFTVTRTITGSPQTVNLSIGGTASNGTDYTNALGGALTTTIVFAAGDSSTNITIVPIDDGASEPTETVAITVLGGPGYVAAGNATAAIVDNDPALLSLSTVGAAPTMFERHANDYASVTVNRWGDTNLLVTLNAANFTFGGSAVLTTDFVVDSSQFPFNINPGDVAPVLKLVNPVDNAAYTGNKSIVVSMTSGGGFSVTASNATLTIIDDENPPAPVLYSNPLTDAADAVNWNLTYANGDLPTLGGTDYEASFGYDLVADPLGVGPIAAAPSGATKALRVTVNKNVANNAGVNLYPTNITVSGDYALRFNMNVIVDTAGGTTQGPLFGINHDGTQTNWWAGSGVVAGGPWASDGIWYWISADGGAGAGDYLLHTGLGGVLPNTGWTRPIGAGLLDNFTQVFKGPPAPYSGYGGPGLVANDPPALGGNNANWTDVEIKQIGRRVNMYLNKILVLTYSNSTTFTGGRPMLGYSDPFNSVGNPVGAVYYSDLRIVRLAAPQITNINRAGTNVTIQFNSNDGTDNASNYRLQSSVLVTGTYTNLPSAVITALPGGNYQATASTTEATRFFRILKQ